MEDNFRKPLYKDYKKQRPYLSFLKDPVLSRERIYVLADKPLAVFGEVLVLAASLIISLYVSRYFSSVFYGVSGLLTICLFYLVNIFYAYFVYRHGRFHVEWEHSLEHPAENASDNCGRNGNFLKTEENRKAARKSRRAFLVLFLAVAVITTLFYVFAGAWRNRG